MIKVTMRLSVETLCVVAFRFRNSDLNSELDIETSFGAIVPVISKFHLFL